MKKGSYAVIVVLLSQLIIGISTITALPSTDQTFTMAVLKGPSGIASSWLISAPPLLSGTQFAFPISGSADLVIAKFISGEIDAGVLPVNVAAKLYNSGIPIRAIAVVGNGMVRFLTTDERITTISDIQGKDVYIAGQKATPDYLFRYLAAKERLFEGTSYYAKYSFAYPEIAAFLASGKIAYAVVPEPFATQAIQLNSKVHEPFILTDLWRKYSGELTYPMSLLVVSAKAYQEKSSALLTLVEAYKVSIEKTLAEPVKTAQLAESLNLGIKADTSTIAIPRSGYIFQPALHVRSSIEKILNIFLDFEATSIGGKLPGNGFYIDWSTL